MPPRKSTKPNQSPSTAAGRSSRKRDQLQTTASIALDIVANVTGASDILAPLTAACKTTKSIIDVKQTIDDNQGDWNDLVRRLEEYMWAIESQIDSLEKYPPEDRVVDEAFSQPLIRYVELLEDIHCAIVNNAHKRPRTRRSAVMAIGNVKIDAGLIRKFNRDIEDRHRQFMEALALFTGHRIQVIEQHTKSTAAKVETIVSDIDASFICQLPVVAFVPSSVHSTCLQGTRLDVLEKIKTWAEDDTSDKPIFWLCDVAGSGKSTVAMSAAETWPRRRIPKSSARRKRVVLIVDAVDECKSGPQRSELLDTFVKAARESRNLKIFITSRPDPVIESVLQPLSIKSKLEDRLHDITYRDNMDDIATYVHQSLYTVLPEDKRQQLIEKAHGLFIWASTACRMINSKTAWDTPETIYDWLTSVDQSGDIDDVYKLIFERVDPRFHTVMCGMLALLLAAFEPLTANDLDNILKHIGLRGYSDALIRNLGSVLIQDKATKVIQFRHPTLVEYLRRCYDTPVPEESSSIYINIHDAHGQIASWCFSNLQSRQGGLKFNVCEIESSFYRNRDLPDLEARVSKFIGRNLGYSSLHWPFHMAQADSNWRSKLRNELRQMIRIPYILYWMEVLSFIQGVPRAIDGLRAMTRDTTEKETRSRIINVRRFMMAFSVPIQESAPHIYVSALPFTPIESYLHMEGLDMYKGTLKVTKGLEQRYRGLPEALRGHTEVVETVAFSPDGSRIVSGSWDQTIRLWDAETSQSLGEPLRGHTGPVTAVAFSPDGSRVVSGSDDQTIRLWDAETGQSSGEPLRGHTGAVTALAFSPDGLRIVSGSWDDTIRLWDAETGQSLGEPLRGHPGEVSAVAFSPDGSRIVSGAWDNTIRLWNAETGQSSGEPLRGHSGVVNAVAFSQDSFLIMTGSADSTVRLSDTAFVQPSSPNGHLSHPTEGSIISHQNFMALLRVILSHIRRFPLSDDGWVHLSGKLLFWVPPDNRLSLTSPLLLTIPTSSPPYPTKIDFTRFEYGSSWTNVRGNVNQ
ncbi:COMPASS-like H3K4 histone methylase component WDR5B {ECO:0000303/PubMed:19567704} Short=AtWDR5B {ECO:0000303/PubMed:19567704} [Serendipita indica DSM 11827]|nr:COMPASS-like H3K4 histone methylase component WDR5B {ECO:0000303/PubMed:19567704} Short=AtWDR5B {ECO:0000303/PubMed:19567704} [Serendipita indica DSM 11827]